MLIGGSLLFDNKLGGVAYGVARLTCIVEVVGSRPIKGLRCFLEQ